MKLTNIRLLNQQLVKPEFRQPKDLVAWMGAVQAQSYSMAKWAIGIRLASGTLQAVEESLRKGEILRTHVMRPTWHFVAAEDIRWMLQLTGQRIKTACESYARSSQLEITPKQMLQSFGNLQKMLEGNKSLTRQEIGEALEQQKIITNDHRITTLLGCAEAEGVICSGIDKGSKTTYALLEERVPPMKELAKEEALACFARKYFQSHSPATLNDFVWWSGLTKTEAKQAIYSIESELTQEVTKEMNGEQTWYIHTHCRTNGKVANSCFLLPSYDEFLISYKDRTGVLPLAHHPKAFTNNGLFYPVILHNGTVVGNWTKNTKKNEISVGHSYFEPDTLIDESLLETARGQYESFLFTPKKLKTR